MQSTNVQEYMSLQYGNMCLHCVMAGSDTMTNQLPQTASTECLHTRLINKSSELLGNKLADPGSGLLRNCGCMLSGVLHQSVVRELKRQLLHLLL